MGFPVTPLRWTAEAALGADLTAAPSTWSWTDVTALVRGPQITINRGRASEFSTAPPARGSATMANGDGRWVEQNPTGVWYGLIGFNTPIRYMIAPDVNTASDDFNRTTSNGFGTAVSGGAWAVNGTASEYSTTGSAARLTLATAATRRYAVLPNSYMTFDVTIRIRTAALATGAALSAGILWHYALSSDNNRYEIIFNTDQSISTRAVARIASAETVGATVVSGLTHVANTWYQVRIQSTSPDARQVRLKVWPDNTTQPGTWTIHNTLTSALNPPAGKIGLTGTRETGNTNANAVIEFDDLTFADGPVPRHTGYIDGLPRRWGDHSATVLNAPINALGMSGRLQQGAVPASAIRRGVLTAGVTPRAYWPGEDKATSSTIASAIPGGLPMQITQPMTLGSGQAVGSDPLVVATNSGRLYGRVQPYVGTDWTVMQLINVPAAMATSQDLMIWTTSGSYVAWQLVLTPQAGPDLLSLQAYDSLGVEHIGDTGVSVGKPYAQQLWIEVSAAQVGADINWSYTVWTGPSGVGKVGTRTAATAGTVTSMAFGGNTQFAGTVLGHFSAWDNATTSLGSFGYAGWAGESATSRLTRLAAQEMVPITLVSTPTYDVATMGAPTSGTVLSQLREIEATDVGILYDEVDGTIAYLPREARTNRAVALTLDVALGQVAWPTEVDNDNQQLVNDATSTQPDGTSYRYLDTTSSRSVTKIGYYPKPFATNLFLPQDLRQDAEFRVALGTVPEDRWTTLTISLTGNPSLIPAWLQCNIGSRIQIINTAALYTPDPVDLIIEGYQEDISSTDWRVTLYTSSAKPWNAWIAETGTGNSSLPDSGTSTLAAGVTSSATSLSIATSDVADLWTTGVVNFDIGIAGERMTVTNIAGASSPQTFTVTRHVNGVVKAQTATDALGNPTKVSLWGASVLAL